MSTFIVMVNQIMSNYFYQDYLMNFPYDDNEFPIVELKYINDINNVQKFNEPYNLFDFSYGYIRYFNFSELHELEKESEWNDIFLKITKFESVIIVDDLPIKNNEVKDMKEFYLKVYYWNFLQHNPNVFIYIEL